MLLLYAPQCILVHLLFASLSSLVICSVLVLFTFTPSSVARLTSTSALFVERSSVFCVVSCVGNTDVRVARLFCVACLPPVLKEECCCNFSRLCDTSVAVVLGLKVLYCCSTIPAYLYQVPRTAAVVMFFLGGCVCKRERGREKERWCVSGVFCIRSNYGTEYPDSSSTNYFVQVADKYLLLS